MFKVPIRALAEKFSLISKVTTPFPLPVPADVIEIQTSLVVTSQEQTLAELTLTDPLPPLAVKNRLEGESVVGLITEKVAVAELLLGLESKEAESTVAVLVMVWLLSIEQVTVA